MMDDAGPSTKLTCGAHPHRPLHRARLAFCILCVFVLSSPLWPTVLRSSPIVDTLQPPRSAAGRVPAADAGLDGDVLPGLSPTKLSPAGANALAPGFYQTSEFMLGTVAVAVITPQCSGTIEACTETWTPSALDQVLANVQAGTDWWVEQMHGRVSYVIHEERQVPTAYEPIRHTQREDKLWIGDVMAHLGFTGSTHLEQVYAYDNWLRQTYGTDWAFTIFVANSRASATGTFGDGRFSYSYVPGPYTVATYDNGRYTIKNMAAVIAHETGHIFGALDEYASANMACTILSGYLMLPNQNSQQSCATDTDSIMRGGLGAYTNHLVDPYALAMVGQHITGQGDLPDPINTSPAVTLDALASTITQTDPTITGVAQDVPYNPPQGPGITINFVTAVRYRIDGGEWQPALPSDGSSTFHKASQGFTFTPLLGPGSHLLAVQATNRVGHLSPVMTRTITVDAP